MFFLSSPFSSSQHKGLLKIVGDMCHIVSYRKSVPGLCHLPECCLAPPEKRGWEEEGGGGRGRRRDPYSKQSSFLTANLQAESNLSRAEGEVETRILNKTFFYPK